MLQSYNPTIQKESRTATAATRRRKIWQIPQAYYCAIVGTCLGRKDLQALAKKKVFQLQKNTSDYDLHKIFSNEADNRSDRARALHKYLDTKHKTAIKKYSRYNTAEDIETEWENDLSRKNVAGAFWAIITHPESNSKIISRVYGDCHMLSFDVFSQQQQQNRQRQALQRQIAQQQKQLTEKQNKNEQLTVQACNLKKELKELRQQATIDRGLIKNMTESNARLTEQLEQIQFQQQQNEKHRELLTQQQENKNLLEKINEANKENRLKAELLNLSQTRVERLEALTRKLQQQNKEQSLEIDNMKTALMFHQQSNTVNAPCNCPASPCETCEDLNTERCQGPDLCGKTVLYVGGLHKMIPRYRELVEQYGGKFLHHDGGKENSKQMLPKLLGGADAVLCPIDCVSHDACKCVKKICKRYAKPFVMMRSSGLSSLAKELTNIYEQT